MHEIGMDFLYTILNERKYIYDNGRVRVVAAKFSCRYFVVQILSNTLAMRDDDDCYTKVYIYGMLEIIQIHCLTIYACHTAAAAVSLYVCIVETDINWIGKPKSIFAFIYATGTMRASERTGFISSYTILFQVYINWLLVSVFIIDVRMYLISIVNLNNITVYLISVMRVYSVGVSVYLNVNRGCNIAQNISLYNLGGAEIDCACSIVKHISDDVKHI